MELTELVEVRLSFLAIRGDPPAREEMVTSGGVEVGDIERLLEEKFFGLERQMDTTPSRGVELWFWFLLELWFKSGLKSFW